MEIFDIVLDLGLIVLLSIDLFINFKTGGKIKKLEHRIELLESKNGEE